MNLLLQREKNNLIKEQQKKQETGIVINQDILENQVRTVFIAIGSNLGDRFKNIQLAKTELLYNKIIISKSSSIYETLSWPNIKNPKFLNVVLKIKTSIKSSKFIKFM